MWLQRCSLFTAGSPLPVPGKRPGSPRPGTDFRDCQVILVGSSLTEFGLSPSVVQEEVERHLGLKICVLNLGQRGLSSESAVSYLRAVLARSQPEILIWGTSPQECMMHNQGHYLQTYASPSDVVRASYDVPASFRDAGRGRVHERWSSYCCRGCSETEPPNLPLDCDPHVEGVVGGERNPRKARAEPG